MDYSYLESFLMQEIYHPLQDLTGIDQDWLMKTFKGEVIRIFFRHVFNAMKNLTLGSPPRFAKPASNVAGDREGPVVLAQMSDASMASEDVRQPS
jgi:hypothetical protein